MLGFSGRIVSSQSLRERRFTVTIIAGHVCGHEIRSSWAVDKGCTSQILPLGERFVPDPNGASDMADSDSERFAKTQ